MITGLDYVTAARHYLGVRWQHLGRSTFGVDCIGLLTCAADDVGIRYPPPWIYERGTRSIELYAVFAQFATQVPIDQTRDGDLLLFSESIYPAHCGIRSTLHDLPHVIHAHIRRRKVVEELLSHDLLAHLRRAYRLEFAAHG